jgi:putative transposase
VLLVWRSLRVPTIYARKQRPASNRQKRDEILKEEISRVYANNYDAFGARKMHSVLNREPDPLGRGHVARCTIERLMKNLGLHGIKTAKAPNTTRSAPRENCPADLVDRHFAAFAPDRLWVADITYVHTFTGWVYVALVTDVFNREIVGWQVSRSLHTELALDALQRGGGGGGIYQRKCGGGDLSGLVHHSDRSCKPQNWNGKVTLP